MIDKELSNVSVTSQNKYNFNKEPGKVALWTNIVLICPALDSNQDITTCSAV